MPSLPTSNQSLSNSAFTNLYPVTKTVRFVLNDLPPRALQIATLTQEIVSSLNMVNDNLNEILYTDSNCIRLDKQIVVRQKWANDFCKIEFRQYKIDKQEEAEKYNKKYNPEREIQLITAFVKDHIKNWFVLLNESIDAFEHYLNFESNKSNLPKEEKNKLKQTQISELNIVLKKLLQRSILPSIIEFLQRIKVKNTDSKDNLIKTTRKIIMELYVKLKAILDTNLNDTMNGSRILRGSFNYYSISKLPKTSEEYEREKKELEDQLLELCSKSNFNEGCLSNSGFEKNTINEYTLKEASDLLKNFKTDQKRQLNLEIDKQIKDGYNQNNLTNEIINQIFSKFKLFKSSSENLREFFKQTIELKKLSNDYNQNNNVETKKEIEKIAVMRGEYYQKQCKIYNQFCDLYKSIRLKEGAIIGKLKNLEQEQYDSQQLTHWALLTKHQNKLQVLLLSKEKKINIWKDLQKKFYQPKSEEIKLCSIIYELKSLTVQALFKQIITDKEYHSKIENCDNDQFQIDKIKIKYCIKQLKENKVLDIEDYKLNIDEFSELTNFEIFKKKLEKQCYFLKRHYILEGDYTHAIKQFNLTTIDCYDFKPRPKLNRVNEKQQTVLWDKFVSNLENEEYLTRLNPEFSIFYRNILTDEKTQFIKNNELIEIENRRNKPRYTINLTITQSCNKLKPKTTKINVLEQMKEFNDKINKKIDLTKNITFYGIDRGSHEMATLCRVSLQKDKIDESLAKNTNAKKPEKDFPLYKPEFKPFKYYKLKDGVSVFDNNELQKLLKNPSLCLTEFENRIEIFNKFFVEVCLSSIDLTCAKLIKSKFHNSPIMLEVGDLFTYLEFAKETAKSKIYEIIVVNKSLNSNLEWVGDKMQIQEIDIYYHSNLQVQSKEDILNFYKSYIEELKSKLQQTKMNSNVLEKERLWNLKKSLSANSVGILDYLYKKEKGFIVLENLNIKQLNDQTLNATAIHRQFEQALYQKWQNYGSVPPKINMPNMWKSIYNNKDKDIQLGCILLVEETNTSNTCPRCGYKNSEYCIKDSDFEKLKIKNLNLVDQKWVQHRFGCVGLNTGNCGFDTGTQKNNYNIEPNLCRLEGLTTSDSVAAYNIAKQGLQLLINLS